MNYIDDGVFLSAPYNVQEALLSWYTFNDYQVVAESLARTCFGRG